jgi:hypothetical protein
MPLSLSPLIRLGTSTGCTKDGKARSTNESTLRASLLRNLSASIANISATTSRCSQKKK